LEIEIERLKEEANNVNTMRIHESGQSLVFCVPGEHTINIDRNKKKAIMFIRRSPDPRERIKSNILEILSPLGLKQTKYVTDVELIVDDYTLVFYDRIARLNGNVMSWKACSEFLQHVINTMKIKIIEELLY
jgi:hypothetical protein